MEFDKNYFINCFPDLNSSELLDELSKIAIKLTFDKEKTILDTGSEVKLIPLVLKGSIKVFQEDESGRELLLYYIKSGESCIMSIIAGKNNQKSQVRAVISDNAEVLLFPSSLINIWSDKYKTWNEFVFNLYQKRFQELVYVINELAFGKVDRRLMQFLETRVKIDQTDEIIITHQKIADEIGTAREVVSRLLKKLEYEGKVYLMRGKIKVLNN